MAKQFLANRSGQTPTLDEVPNEVIKIYDDKAAADLDIANIEENEIVATKAGESEGVVEVVDTVEENNPNAVSSGAVFDAIKAIYSFNTSSWGSPVSERTVTLPAGKAIIISISEWNNNTSVGSPCKIRFGGQGELIVVGYASGQSGATGFYYNNTSADIIVHCIYPNGSGNQQRMSYCIF